ncbi:MAG: hypothetical protein K2G63_05725 [Oscillospiraceae bacterium]|nr:hypothetical protein [Oscillospiraceae bacterium]
MLRNNYENMFWCKIQMKKYQKRYNFMGKIYLLANVSIFLLDVAMIILHPKPFSYFLDIIIRGTAFFFGITGCTKKDVKMCVIAVMVTAVNFNFNIYSNYTMYIFYIVSCFASLICLPMFMILNRKYNILKQAKGFPYFNERFEDQKKDSQRDINKEYQDMYYTNQNYDNTTMDEI